MDVSLPDSVAVHDQAVAAGKTLAGWLLTHVFTNMPDAVVGWATLGIATAFGLITGIVWHRLNVFFHDRSSLAMQERLRAFWAVWGKLIGIILSGVVAGGSSGQWIALLPTILAAMPSAAFGGVSSALTSQKASSVSHGRLGALVLVLGALALASVPGTARAGVPSILAPPREALSLDPMPALSVHRFVGVAAVGYGWSGPKWTDHPAPFGRAAIGYQVSAPVQVSAGFRRALVTGAPWRPEVELKFVFAP